MSYASLSNDKQVNRVCALGFPPSKLQLIICHNAMSVTAAAAVGKYSQIP